MILKVLSENVFDRASLLSSKTNWSAICSEIQGKEWDQLFRGLTPTEMLQALMEICENAVFRHSPKKTQKRKHSVPRDRRILMRKRSKKRKQLLQERDESRMSTLRMALSKIEEDLQKSYKQQTCEEERIAVDAIKVNPKHFYVYAKKKLKTPSQIGPFINDDGEYIDHPKGLADMLSDQFSSVFSVPITDETNSQNLPTTTLNDIEFDEADMISAIDEVASHAAAGPDRFPALLLKNCKHALARPLCLLWRASLDTGDIPDMLKTSVITPIYKKGSKLLPENYRPVALTSHIIKIFEKIMRSHLVKYIETHNLLNPNQHGFRAGRSCLSQLLQHYDMIIKHMEAGKNVDVIYIDFAKAFDKLDFTLTLQKLNRLGISGKILRWIKSFLTGRIQMVHVRGAKSKPAAVMSGVPQGSVIGPLLFLVLIGDIDIEVEASSVSSFADDTRILGPVSETDDVLKVQKDLDSIYEWSRTNNTQLNADKFECVRYGRNLSLKSSSNYLDNTGMPIAAKDSLRDLGVTISSDATFEKHIEEAIEAARKKCAWVLRTFETRQSKLMITLWKSLILPLLEYCCQLWSPSVVGKIQALENVQLSFFKKIQGMSGKTYWEQLSSLNTFSLQRRRERYIIIYVWKMLEGLVPDMGVEVLYNRRHGRACVVPHIRTSAPTRVQNLRFSSFAVNGPRLFNAMPDKIRNMTDCSLNTFKNALDQHLKHIPDEPRVRGLIQFCSRATNSLIDMRA